MNNFSQEAFFSHPCLAESRNNLRLLEKNQTCLRWSVSLCIRTQLQIGYGDMSFVHSHKHQTTLLATGTCQKSSLENHYAFISTSNTLWSLLWVWLCCSYFLLCQKRCLEVWHEKHTNTCVKKKFQVLQQVLENSSVTQVFRFLSFVTQFQICLTSE